MNDSYFYKKLLKNIKGLKMKSLLSLILFLLFSANLIFAQNYFNKGTYSVSGSISYLSSTRDYYYGEYTSEKFTFSPIGSYFFINRFSTGMEFSYVNYNTSIEDLFNTHLYKNTLLLGPIIRYYLANSKLSSFIEISYGFIINNLEDIWFSDKSNQSGYNVKLGIGVNYFLTNDVALEPSIIYEYQRMKNMYLIEGNPEEKYLNEKNISIGIKLNYYIN